MSNKTEKPYVLRAAEFVYSNIIEIKKQNPEINNIQAAAKAIKPAIDSLIKMKCKKIILGCTELPIAIFAFKSFKNVKSSKVFLDPNLILAHSAMVKHKN